MSGLPVYDLSIEVAFTSALSDVTPVWVDVTDRVRSFTTRRGRDDRLAVVQPGTATFVLDCSDGFFDRDGGGTYASNIRPNRNVRVRAKRLSSSAWHPVWYGYADSWTRSWPDGSDDSITTLECTDRFKLLASRTLVTPVVRGAETAAARIVALLDNNGDPMVPAAETAINTNGYASRQLGAYTYDTSGSALSNLTDAAHADGGQLFMSAEGRMIFQTTQFRLLNSLSTASNGTFGNSSDALIQVGEDYATVVSDDVMANYVRVGDFAGTVQVAADTTAIFNDGPVFAEVGSTLLLAPDAQDRADDLLALLSNPQPLIPRMTINGHDDTAVMAQALAREISDLVTVSFIPPGAASGYSRPQFIEAIEHDVNIEQGSWMTTFSMSGNGHAATVIP